MCACPLCKWAIVAGETSHSAVEGPEFSLLGRLLGRGVFSGVQTVKRVCTVWLKEQLPIREPELLRGRTIVAME